MKKWKEQWKELLPYEKYASIVLQIIGAITIPMLIGTILQSIGIIQSPFGFRVVSAALMSVYSGCYAVRCWRKQRGTAIIHIVTSVLFAITAILYCL